jgi:phytol kinase
VTTAPALLLENPWLGIDACLAAFVLLFVVVQVLARCGLASPEVTRKLMHGGSGLLTLAFPFLFREVWPVVFLTAASAVVIGSVKFIPPLRRRFGRAVSGVGRATLGEIYFPVAVVWLFWLTLDEDPLLYVVPVLLLTFADATCALVGMRYGLTKYEGASKSLEGSVAFVAVAFLCVHVPLLLWSSVGRAESLLIAATLALIVMLLEGSAWRGLDNLFIPIGGYLLLRIYLTLEVDQLAARLAVALALVAAVVAARRSTTLEDDSLVAAAFLCYVAWALMGWRWLVPPIVVFVGYRWLSPATEDNKRRIHGVPAVLSVWAAAVAWLTLAHVRSDGAMLLPYTLVFAAHLAMFGISRLAFQYPDRRLPPLMWRASVVSWVLVLIPYAVSIGIGTRTLLAAAVALPALGVGVVTFVRAQPDIRHARQDARRWVTQAGGAALASLVGWAAWVAVLEGLL